MSAKVEVVKNQSLEDLEGRHTFRGVFVHEVNKNLKSEYCGSPYPLPITVVIKNVKDASGKVVAEEIELNQTVGFQHLETLIPGDVIEFEARVKCFPSVYCTVTEMVKELSYTLERPTKVKRIARHWEHPEGQPFREFVDKNIGKSGC